MDVIAERRLYCRLKETDIMVNVSIRIGVPFLVGDSLPGYEKQSDFFACRVEVLGIDETYPVVFGIDSLQAINIASNIDPFLKRLEKRYDLYWLSGEPYFD